MKISNQCRVELRQQDIDIQKLEEDYALNSNEQDKWTVLRLKYRNRVTEIGKQLTLAKVIHDELEKQKGENYSLKETVSRLETDMEILRQNLRDEGEQQSLITKQATLVNNRFPDDIRDEMFLSLVPFSERPPVSHDDTIKFLHMEKSGLRDKVGQESKRSPTITNFPAPVTIMRFLSPGLEWFIIMTVVWLILIQSVPQLLNDVIPGSIVTEIPYGKRVAWREWQNVDRCGEGFYIPPHHASHREILALL